MDEAAPVRGQLKPLRCHPVTRCAATLGGGSGCAAADVGGSARWMYYGPFLELRYELGGMWVPASVCLRLRHIVIGHRDHGVGGWW